MVVTEKILEEGRSTEGGWSRVQLELLGVPWPPPKDWKREAKKSAISEMDIERFLDLKDKHSSAKMSVVPTAPRGRRARAKVAKLGKWAESNRDKLLSKKNEAEERIDSLLSELPVRYSRERGITVDGKLYFMDFLISSVTSPRRKIRVCLEVDGGYHSTPAQSTLDRKREADLLSTCRVWSIIRITSDDAMAITPEGLMSAISAVKRGGVVFVP